MRASIPPASTAQGTSQVVLTAIGAKFRRIARRKVGDVAEAAIARKLARAKPPSPWYSSSQCERPDDHEGALPIAACITIPVQFELEG
ncbi:MAG: hypothetical protein IPK13_02730 [Deltaproteobacteria bacterium]|nr:hypothetical protein [Deltaproteobacteria bacterium]